MAVYLNTRRTRPAMNTMYAMMPEEPAQIFNADARRHKETGTLPRYDLTIKLCMVANPLAHTRDIVRQQLSNPTADIRNTNLLLHQTRANKGLKCPWMYQRDAVATTQTAKLYTFRTTLPQP